MKKCLLLIPRMGSGGAERVMATIANNLCEKYEVRIITLTDAHSFYKLRDAVTIIGCGQKINRTNKFTECASLAVGGIKAILSLFRAVKTWKPDVMLSFLQSANAMAIILKMLGLLECRVVVSERCDPTVRSWLNRWFEYHFYKYADAIVCQSNNAASYFDEGTQQKICVIPNPISSDAIPQRYEGKRRKCIVAVGRLDEQKNYSMLINAFAKLPESLSEYTLEIYGGGNQEASLRVQIDRLSMGDRVFLKGVKPNVMFHVADAALYVMSSDFEGFPNALVEAMATGLPVISTDFSTGVAKELIHEENGKLIPVGDEAALVEAMTEVLSESGKWDAMSRKNCRILDVLSEEKVFLKWEDVLDLKQ